VARIRTIKPELLEDEKTATLSDVDWRLFVSCLLLADDYGNFRGDPGLIAGKAMWGSGHKSDAISEALVRLEETGLIQSYSVRGQNYVHIQGWSKHQRVDKPGAPLVPGPDDPEKTETQVWWTYFVRLGPSGLIKIGKTTNVERRIAIIQTSAPAKLVLLKAIPRNVETECHRRFKSIKSHGEWFKAKPELLEFIEQLSDDENDSRIVREPDGPDLEKEEDQDLEEDREEDCSEPPEAASEPAILVFPTVGKGPKQFGLTRSMVDAWSDVWPGIDVLAEAKKALAWVNANPTKRKTASGMPAFLTRWCNRAQDRGAASGKAAGPPRPSGPTYLTLHPREIPD